MHNNYGAGHRPKREDARNKELVDLRKENGLLRRTVKRLKKQVAKHGIPDIIEEEDVVEQETVQPVHIQEHCKCGSSQEPRVLVLNGKVYSICPECKARQKIGEEG